MKRIVIASLALLAVTCQAYAADMSPPPYPAPVPPPAYPPPYAPIPGPPIYNWTGFYIGGNGGYGFGNSNWTDSVTSASIGSFNTSGALAGGTVGANFQYGPAVFGIEGDGDWSNLTGTNNNCFPGCQTNSNFLGTVRGRVGYAFDQVLVYGTGGAAFGNLQTGISGGSFSNSNATGWTAGGGIEVAVAPRLTAKVEYLYVNLGNANCSAAFCGATVTPNGSNVAFTENIIRGGFNFKFGPWWW